MRLLYVILACIGVLGCDSDDGLPSDAVTDLALVDRHLPDSRAGDAATVADTGVDATLIADAGADAVGLADGGADAAARMDLGVDVALPADAGADVALDARVPCAAGDVRACPDSDACPGATQTCINGVFGACVAPLEVCNGRDDDCDGEVDEDLPLEAWFPDPDDDGFFGARPADVQPSCAAWYATGAREDGVYRIDPDGADGDTPFEVLCDMTTDGGGWTRVFFHDVADGYWAELDPLAQAADTPDARRYSILGRLEAFRSSDGLFDFRMHWPDTGIEGRNIWRQRSNPTTDAIAGYAAVEIDHVDNGWGGLERNVLSPASFIDGTVGHPNWFYAIASIGPWGNPPGIPAQRLPAARVALWVRPDDAVVRVDPMPVQACGPRAGISQVGGDCLPDVAEAFPGAAEICDGIDNDCNGQIDEGFEYVEWYPDRDEDGRGASGGSSCASLLADGVDVDGIHTIRPGGVAGPTLDVVCDMTTDGGGWTRIFGHDVAGGYFESDADATLRAADDPAAALYSILMHVEHFRSAWGGFELRIDWPDLMGRNIWRQTSDPTTAPVMGYAPVSVDHTAQFWGGLERSSQNVTFLDGSVGHPNWFYAIGAQTPWRPNNAAEFGIPAYGPQAAGVALWVRPDDDVAGGTPVFDCVAPVGYVAVPGDCDDTDPAIGAGADERCNGVDDDCDAVVDEGCAPGDVGLSRAPTPLHFYPRDPQTNTCVAGFTGRLVGAADTVRVRALRGDEQVAAVRSADAEFDVDVAVEAGLHRYRFVVEWTDADALFWRPVATFDDVVCGDVFVIDGQSNAVATDYHRENLGNVERNPFVRTFGSTARDASVQNVDHFAIAIAHGSAQAGPIGQWGMRLANLIKDAERIPILVINGAVGGTRVDQHQRDDAQPENLATIYGRLLWRVRRAGVADRVRAIFWHQGESDGQLPYDTYLQRWTAMYDDWLADYANVEDIFVFQVRAGCGNPTWNRNVARDLPTILERVSASMSTTGVDGHDNCHFFHATYIEWARRMARLVQRDLYDAEPVGNIDAPNPQGARWRTPTELVIEFGPTGGGLVLQPGASAYFALQDGADIVDARVEETTVVLTTAAPSAATWVTFADVPGDIPWLINDLDVGAFAFYELPIEAR